MLKPCRHCLRGLIECTCLHAVPGQSVALPLPGHLACRRVRLHMEYKFASTQFKGDFLWAAGTYADVALLVVDVACLPWLR